MCWMIESGEIGQLVCNPHAIRSSLFRTEHLGSVVSKLYASSGAWDSMNSLYVKLIYHTTKIRHVLATLILNTCHLTKESRFLVYIMHE